MKCFCHEGNLAEEGKDVLLFPFGPSLLMNLTKPVMKIMPEYIYIHFSKQFNANDL